MQVGHKLYKEYTLTETVQSPNYRQYVLLSPHCQEHKSNHKNAHALIHIIMIVYNYVICSVTMHVCIYAGSAVLLQAKKVQAKKRRW